MVVGGAPDRCAAPLAAERVALFALDAGALMFRLCHIISIMPNPFVC
jgi:hypothetical protein